MTDEACREQVQRLLGSNAFHASPALRRLLSYLAEKSLTGAADDLKEYTVGLEALGKGETYDPRQDSSVRFQSSKLRQRLTDYYQSEGLNDPVVIEYPRGRFKLAFTPRPVEIVPEVSTQPAVEVRKWRRVAMALSVGLLLAVAAAVYFALASSAALRKSTRAEDGWTDDLTQIWSPFLTGKRPILVCIGTPLFVHYKTGFVRLPDLNDWEAVEQSDLVAGLNKVFRPVEPRPYFNFTGTGDATGAFDLARLLAPRTSQVSLTRTVVLSWDEIASNNMVFLGPPKFNAKLHDIGTSLQQDFRIERHGIRNLKPAGDEPKFFPDGSRAPDVAEGLSGETHALISRSPGLHGNGDVFVLSGNWTPGTQAAVEYVTRPTYAAELVRKLRLPNGRLPRHYELVIKVKFRQGSPVQIWPVASHFRP